MSNKAGHFEQQHQELGHRNVFGRAVVDRLTDGANGLRKTLDGMMPWHVPSIEMHLGRTMVVAGDEAEQDFGKETAFLRPQPSHDAEINGDQSSVIVHEQIAWMHVGVKEAVAQRVAKKALDHFAPKFRQIEALGFRAHGGR